MWFLIGGGMGDVEDEDGMMFENKNYLNFMVFDRWWDGF